MREVSDADGRSRTRLETWGEIANHLGVEVRTAQRWEARNGLPVHRLKGTQAVFAYVDEISAWQASREVGRDDVSPATGAEPADAVEQADEHRQVETAQAARPDNGAAATAVEASGAPQDVAAEAAADLSTPPVRAPVAWNEWALVVGVVATIVGVGYLAVRVQPVLPAPPRSAPLSEPTELVLQGRRLVALGLAGTVLWSYDFGEAAREINAPNRPDMHPWWTRADADGDGSDELLLVVGHPRGTDLLTEVLYCLTLDGKLRYSYTPGFSLSFLRGRYEGPWAFWDIEPVPDDRSVWVALGHHTWWPSAVVRLDARGSATIRYIQPGHVRLLRTMRRDGRTLVLAGGVNNEYASASLALLDPRLGPAAAPQSAEGPYACLGCPASRPICYLLFPPSVMNAAEGLPYNRVGGIFVHAATIQVITDETEKVPIHYTVDSDLHVTAAMPSDGYLSWRPPSQWKGPATLLPTATVRIWERGAWSQQRVPFVLPETAKSEH